PSGSLSSTRRGRVWPPRSIADNRASSQVDRARDRLAAIFRRQTREHAAIELRAKERLELALLDQAGERDAVHHQARAEAEAEPARLQAIALDGGSGE